MTTENEFARKFLSNESFREEVKKDPKGTMRAHGVHVPDGMEIEVIESTPEKHYVVMPPLQADEISDEQLASVQGGTVANSIIPASCLAFGNCPPGR